MAEASEVLRGRKAAATLRPLPRPDDITYRAACREAGVVFTPIPEAATPRNPETLTSRAARRLKASVMILPGGSSRMVLAPRPHELEAMASLARAHGALVTTPRRLEEALRRSIATRVIAGATSLLHRREPLLSARECPSIGMRILIGAMLCLLPAALIAAGWIVFWALSVATTLAFLTLTLIRLQAAAKGRPPDEEPPPIPTADLPTYTVLVPLRHEAAMIPGLVRRLENLDYPPSRLEVRILVEADDKETRRAAEAACLRSDFQVIEVPPGAPRTKPRALEYGLAFTTGDIVTVFDAEDRPAPDQLRKAAAALVHGPPDLACVQARLDIDRPRTMLQRQFAIEYAALFDGMLPWLAAERLPLPLGGTSNHFKRDALDYVFGWDPYNVTEDADLGVRLYRYGLRTGVVRSATAEDAPARWTVWHRQRVRWLKGWMITWLVHSRQPRTAIAEMGPRNWWMMQAYAVNAVFAPLLHPIGIAQLVATLSGLVAPPGYGAFWYDVLCVTVLLSTLLGYGAAMTAAWRVIVRHGRRDLLAGVPALPFYWLLVSLAAWCAVVDLVRRPHHWAKTPHEPGEDGN